MTGGLGSNSCAGFSLSSFLAMRKAGKTALIKANTRAIAV
ncbi:hypothetical protein SGADD03_01606 [Streptococcus gallolyticus]|uniref:Uncharacterized protein n=1 Tax=Streptococcus gallolyticus TaxID=315405 RepID=A0A139QTH6_9STRE|nr:hypothetical protein SGADD03_01606 [Streptococcus gallolyticus]